MVSDQIETRGVRVQIQVPAHPASVAICRRFVKFLEDLAHLGRGEDLQVIVSELVTNSIRHAALGPDDHIVVSVEMNGDRLVGSVIDHGPGFRNQDLGPRDDGSGGFGLHIVQQIADRWRLECDDETRVTFELGSRGELEPVAP